MNDRSENDLIRRLEMLGAVQPSPEAAHRAVDRVRQALAERRRSSSCGSREVF